MRFPRIRGDVPQHSYSLRRGTRFSPHTRGCSWRLPHPLAPSPVFPAYAGMFRTLPGGASNAYRFPRIRGDVPNLINFGAVSNGFSPHTRGCSANRIASCPRSQVFPAYAGMFRLLVKSEMHYGSFPRIRGDVPIAAMLAWDKLFVFPAYAGMFLTVNIIAAAMTSFPRIRGDVPRRFRSAAPGSEFSPHTRGCS